MVFNAQVGHSFPHREDLVCAIFYWLKDVLQAIGDTPVNQLAELLPHNWGKKMGLVGGIQMRNEKAPAFAEALYYFL